MATATLSARETASNPAAKTNATARRGATDDEILGIGDAPKSSPTGDEHQVEFTWGPAHDDLKDVPTKDAESRPDSAPELKALLDSNPELRSAWDDAAEYRKTFPTPADARMAGTKLADLDRLDALFFSGRPEDHAELARTVAALDPAAFTSLRTAMAKVVSTNPEHAGPQSRGAQLAGAPERVQSNDRPAESVPASVSPAGQKVTPANVSPENGALTPAQTQFFHSTNAAAVEEVLHAIESQVQKILPEEISKSAQNRVVGEIYRELDNTLRSNRQLAQQMRDAFRSGALDSEHQRAIVSLVASRARQALPAVAKRVLNEWTSTVVAANQDRRARQRTAERRVDIAGSGRMGSEGHRRTSARDIDYARMSDSDILNL